MDTAAFQPTTVCRRRVGAPSLTRRELKKGKHRLCTSLSFWVDQGETLTEALASAISLSESARHLEGSRPRALLYALYTACRPAALNVSAHCRNLYSSYGNPACVRGIKVQVLLQWYASLGRELGNMNVLL